MQSTESTESTESLRASLKVRAPKHLLREIQRSDPAHIRWVYELMGEPCLARGQLYTQVSFAIALRLYNIS